jgi:predicted MPP superfamily phosphohydrolase
VNWAWFVLRSAIGLTILTTLILSQRFWYRSIWRVTARWRVVWLRVAVRLVYILALLLILAATADGFRMGHRGHLIPSDNLITIFSGLWFSSALFAYLAVKIVRGIERLWTWLQKTSRTKRTEARSTPDSPALPPAAPPPAHSFELLPDPSRRYFFRAATALAGATPFLSAVYGFASERLNYQVHRVEVPLANLPPALDGMQIVQLSDIHLSGYMTRMDVRRAVEMANELGADLAVVTGDFITGASDPISDCIDEVRHLRAPLGVWGCNGNHEIYAKAQELAEQLFAQAGMKLLRQENAQLVFRGAKFNLIGVDYQRERTSNGNKQQMLPYLERLVRRDMPNILLSHNPNTFNRAAELGIELSLAGHTHGGQIQVEILDHRLSPARFITDYIAGLYSRPLGAGSKLALGDAAPLGDLVVPAHLYVNRGLGTVGAPVRLGVPPEISLLVLRRG